MGGNKGMKTRMGLFLLLVTLLGVPAIASGRPQEEPELPDTSQFYDLLVMFDAKTACVAENGPYLVKLSQHLELNRIRFVFRKVHVYDVAVNWYPLYGSGTAGMYPVLTFMEKSKIEAELCPHIKCEKEIKKAWFTKQNKSCMAVMTVVPLDEIADISDQIIDMNDVGDMADAVVPLERHVLHVKILSNDSFAWTGECIVRQQDCGATDDLEFYLGLPSLALRKGQHLHREFPFHSDSIDAEGSLRIWLVPIGKP